MKFRKGILLISTLSVLVSASFAAESTKKKSLWDSISEFFSPRVQAEKEGPLYKELADIDNEIQDVQWRYGRERRAVKKNRYKIRLQELHVSRDSLADLIEKYETGKLSSAVQPVSSSVVQVPSSSSVQAKSSSSALSSSQELSSSSADSVAASSSSLETVAVEVPACPQRVDSVVVTTTITKFVRDTVFVHDTLVVRDTVYVPEAK
ncbi:MAG: hypothetical protein J6Z31_02495 [Fibrobacter sp.]|nr:hypothetical protein [Fibrobacter sp.]